MIGLLRTAVVLLCVIPSSLGNSGDIQGNTKFQSFNKAKKNLLKKSITITGLAFIVVVSSLQIRK